MFKAASIISRVARVDLGVRDVLESYIADADDSCRFTTSGTLSYLVWVPQKRWFVASLLMGANHNALCFYTHVFGNQTDSRQVPVWGALIQ